MKGFFSEEDIKTDINPKSPQSCASCGLYKDCETPNMKPYGNFNKKVMIIGEFPEARDDRAGKPFQGRKGRRLERAFKQFGFDIFEDAININSVLCAPENLPTPNETYCCRAKVLKYIKQYKPKLIVLLGSFALKSIIGHIWKKGLGEVGKWRGFHIPDRSLKAWVCPIYDPYFVEHKEEKNGDNLAQLIWEQDIRAIVKQIEIPFPRFKKEEDRITYINKPKELKSILQKLINAPLLSFDYETTGLKPHLEEQKIVSVSACIGHDCYAWMNTPIMQKLFNRVLASKVPKTAHNLQFEDIWSDVKMGQVVHNWVWCSMNNAHILDNRRGITSLKFQTYIEFGVADYDSHISPYLKSPPKEGANALNRIYEAIKIYGEKDILTYNGLDSIFGYDLTVKQMERIHGQGYLKQMGII